MQDGMCCQAEPLLGYIQEPDRLSIQG